MGLNLKDFLAMESEEERIPVEDVIEMDDTETPTEDGETLEPEANEDGSKDTDVTDDETQSEDDQTGDADDAEVGGDEPLDDGEPVIEDEDGVESTENTEGEEDKGETPESEEESEPTEEEKQEAEEALEQLKEIVSNSALTGGLSEGEAELVSMSLNMVGKKVSLSQERMVPSLEAFSEFSSRRLLATNVVLNNIEYALSQLRG